ncbi:MAG: hypothetical protein OXR84_10855 [Magnetovibrio sp.]|nr:hypothetical protein [Magnetovibrio sp.]
MPGLVKKGLAVVAVSLLSLELISLAAIRLHLIPANAPSFVWPSFTPFWAATNPHFGTWHPPDAHVNHTTACYNLVYRTNAHGARDRARALTAGKPRVVMLGDSFIEGYGLARAERLSDELERRTGLEHLNFGTSGGFGPTQSLLLYRHLAKRFAHDAVVLGILPDNDFNDDDPAVAEAGNDPRYAPYFHAVGDGFELRYRNRDSLGPGDKARRRAWTRGAASLLRSFSHAANAIDHLKSAITYQRALDRSLPPETQRYSGYFDYAEGQWARLAHVIRQLLAEAGEKPVTVVLIPRPNDLARARGAPTTPLARDLAGLLAGYANAHLVDLMRTFGADPNPARYFNRCDGHWTGEGSRAAAGALLPAPMYHRLTQTAGAPPGN